MLHGSDKDSGLLGNTRGSKTARARAAAALHNIVHSHPDDKRGRREARVLRLLEQIRAHCDQLRGGNEEEDEENRSRTGSVSTDIDHHPGPAIAALMKLSFDEEHRHAICTLGACKCIFNDSFFTRICNLMTNLELKWLTSINILYKTRPSSFGIAL